jgi:catechol 2,3-dioxygenase-like lactoylglutathione lyase family enzyme
MRALRHHSPEFLIELFGLAWIMFAALAAASLIWAAGSPLSRWIHVELERRALMGMGMSTVVVLFLYSRWGQRSGGHINPFYFKVPDGHPLEPIHFPPGKGDPRWRRGGDRLFLGIDHTAITVANTDASLAFCRDQLGFRVVGGSENYGREQERLSGVPGARVRITALHAPRDAGVELLEYESLRDGRPMPEDSLPSDLIHHEILVKESGAPPQMLRDPDGHLVEVEP